MNKKIEKLVEEKIKKGEFMHQIEEIYPLPLNSDYRLVELRLDYNKLKDKQEMIDMHDFLIYIKIQYFAKVTISVPVSAIEANHEDYTDEYMHETVKILPCVYDGSKEEIMPILPNIYRHEYNIEEIPVDCITEKHLVGIFDFNDQYFSFENINISRDLIIDKRKKENQNKIILQDQED